jgi:hypoxanthine phosphoribosyltransferase
MTATESSILLSESQIEHRIEEIAAQISDDYKGGALTVIGILKGSFIFVADLIRRIDPALPIEVDFIGVSSYGDAVTTSGNVRVTKDLDVSIESKDVVIVEDIVDSGLTLTCVYSLLAARRPHSIRIATLLEKPETSRYKGPLDYVGFQIPSRFVVGYGLDYAQRYRNLPDVRVLDAI